MYEQNWYNGGDIVPDQVTPASDATPLADGTATAGISTEYSRGDHVHPLNVTTTIPISDSASGSVGTTNYYARNDHSHPLNITNSIPPQDSASGSVGTTNYYARNDHSHPINDEINASNIPIVNGVGANGTSAFYARHDHVHPYQLTNDESVTVTKFIKTGGTNNDLQLAEGTTKQITDFNSSIASVIQQINPHDGIHWQCLAVLTIPDYKSLKQNLRIQLGFSKQFIATQFGSIKIDFMIWTINLSQFADAAVRDNFVLQDNINQYNITTYTLPSGSQFAGTTIQNKFTNNGGTINGSIQINPTATSYDDVASQAGDNTGGLQICTDVKKLTFNGNGFVDLPIDQTIKGMKSFEKLIQVIPTSDGAYNEAIRISRPTKNQWSNIQFGCDPYSNSGSFDNKWSIGTSGNDAANRLGFVIVKAGQVGSSNRGLQITADGNTLSFNGRVL
ncbi:MAG: hypothetical protein EZS28_005588 [Streblomastix strix]|uniref:Uncharacterized protein n=1 Tax=Streblomastix strix TaxID=222440 RepID=A0A5J4WV77_9EUKA|nr:MAG: hypothetical protein EZS28_005588 [Streblomastix strix]